MVTDRFNTSSEYDVVGHFHNLKQVASVLDYVDRFEEMVSMVRRHNPSLPDNYFISSFISGLKDQIQYHVQCHKPKPCPRHIGMLKYWNSQFQVSRSSLTSHLRTRLINKK
jgi:hypothetical protein